MSNDIVERLRFKVPQLVPIVDTMKEAAEEIERLQADNERLRSALTEIEKQATSWKPRRYSWYGETARRALERKQADV
jgi:hypothetical protein